MYKGLIDRSGGSVGRSSPLRLRIRLCACASALALARLPLLLRGQDGDFACGNSVAGCGGCYGDHVCDRDDRSGIGLSWG